MVRKQFEISEQQARVLEARARELGVTEAEIIREALERAFSEPELGSVATEAERARLWDEFDAVLDADAREFQPQPGYRFRRDDAYDEPRFTRWNTQRGS